MQRSVIALPSALRALDAASRHVDTPCGRGTMRFRVWGSGPPLLMLHGGSGSWMHWARNIEFFARDHMVVASDTPGLGQSARTSHPEQLQSYAQAIAAGLQSVIGPAPALDILAFSFGSIVSGALLAEPSIDVRKLVLVGPAALGVSKLSGNLVGVRHLEGDARRAANTENLAILMFADREKIDATAIDIQDWNSRHTRIDSRRFARTTSLKEALTVWGKPFAAIIGEKDVTSQPPLVSPVLRSVAPQADIRVLEGIGHWCMYEAADTFKRDGERTVGLITSDYACAVIAPLDKGGSPRSVPPAPSLASVNCPAVYWPSRFSETDCAPDATVSTPPVLPLFGA